MERGLTGGCLCGGVRYECAAEPMLQGHCQCRDCQKGTGTGHSSHFGMPAGALKLSGELRAYETTEQRPGRDARVLSELRIANPVPDQRLTGRGVPDRRQSRRSRPV